MNLPRRIQALLAAYFVATVAHFVHNAEYIAFYPNMPDWITRETVYVAWLAIASVGVAGLVVVRFGWTALGALLIGAALAGVVYRWAGKPAVQAG